MKGFAASAIAVGLALSALPTRAQERVLRMDDGFELTLPEGWRLDEAGDDPFDATGRRRVHLICETHACKRTQETCTLILRSKPVEGENDAARLANLYESPLTRYARLKSVLKSTSKDAEIRQNLAIRRIGEHDWYVVETDARHNYKSGYFAETVIGGTYLGAICKTCETGEIRHQGGQEMLMSLRADKARSAALR